MENTALFLLDKLKPLINAGQASKYYVNSLISILLLLSSVIKEKNLTDKSYSSNSYAVGLLS